MTNGIRIIVATDALHQLVSQANIWLRSLTYRAPSPSTKLIETLVANFICALYSINAGSAAQTISVNIEEAEIKQARLPKAAGGEHFPPPFHVADTGLQSTKKLIKRTIAQMTDITSVIHATTRCHGTTAILSRASQIEALIKTRDME
jgi:hypothetical protein